MSGKRLAFCRTDFFQFFEKHSHIFNLQSLTNQRAEEIAVFCYQIILRQLVPRFHILQPAQPAGTELELQPEQIVRLVHQFTWALASAGCDLTAQMRALVV